MRKLLEIKKCYRTFQPTDRPTYRHGVSTTKKWNNDLNCDRQSQVDKAKKKEMKRNEEEEEEEGEEE